MILAIASGKGGTGKTTLAVSLAAIVDKPVTYVDCDVEEPNGHLFLLPHLEDKEEITVPVPRVDHSRCTFCGKCREVCRFNAIAVLPQSVMIFDELCHGCGGCALVCPEKAIREQPRPIGTIENGRAGRIAFVEGTLKVGEAMSPPLIRAVKQRLPKGGRCVIDAPPGTSCPMIAAVRDADVCLLVTEPTPFGLNDLKLAVETLRALGRWFAVVINRDGIGDHRVEDYCRAEGISIAARIPESRAIAEAYSRGRIAVDAVPEIAPQLRDIWRLVEQVAAPEKVAT
ncbi:MAG: 4Fe-4S binding protein [Myxococcales bacterium]|nr:4Fe-4S binding protein [Myxococcales bacterium]